MSHFISSKDTDKEHVMHSKSNNIEVIIKTELFQSLLSKCQIGLETSMKGSQLIFVFIYCIKNVIK